MVKGDLKGREIKLQTYWQRDLGSGGYVPISSSEKLKDLCPGCLATCVCRSSATLAPQVYRVLSAFAVLLVLKVGTNTAVLCVNEERHT